MNDLFNAILGLDDIRFGGEDVRFELARAIPAWAWAGVAIACAGVAAFGYHRLVGPRLSRGVLAGLRALALILIILLALGPRLVRERSRTERDWVVVLADRSASMTIADAPAGITRDEQLARALRDADATWSDIASRKHILWLGFDAGAFELRTPEGATTPALDEADGLRTSIGDAIDQALRRVAARPVSGVVVLSDGRSAAPVERAVRRRLESDQIPVFAVPLGSPEPATDLAVRRVEAPEVAFVKDTAPVRVEIERLGSGEIPAGARIELVDIATGITLAERGLDDVLARATDSPIAEVTLTPRVESVGARRWVVRLIPGGRDLVPENNERALAIELVDRPLRVLYLDGYPRWDARYLKNMLLREPTIRSSGLLLAPDRQFTQEGDVAVTRLPVSPGEWEEFDVVVVGDLSPELFGRAQLEALREHVAVRGAGLLWIAGPAHTPGDWFASPLGDLLPVRAGADAGATPRLPVFDEPVTLVRAPEGRRLGVLAMSDDPGADWPARLSDPATGWSMLRWAQRIDAGRVKPAAETLAVAVPESRFAPPLLDHDGAGALGEGAPGVLTMRYGAGRVVYVATDEIWRWRYGRGEDLPERFWLPLIRMLGREGLTRAGRPAILRASPERAQTGAPVRIGLELLDQSLVDAAPGSIRVELTPADASGAPIELRLSPDGGADAGGARSFAVAWATTEPGLYDARVTDPLLSPFGLTARVEVARPDDERRLPETDHPALASLAAQTGGRVIQAGALGELAAALPNREQVYTGPREVRTLWDRPAALILLITLLALEWVGRRLIRLA